MTQATNQPILAETIPDWYKRVTKEAVTLGRTLPTLSRTEPQEKIELLGNMRELAQEIIQKQRIGSVALTECADALALYYMQEIQAMTYKPDVNIDIKKKWVLEFYEGRKFEKFLADHDRHYAYVPV